MVAVFAGCNTIWGLEDKALLDASSTLDARSLDGESKDASDPCSFDSNGNGDYQDLGCWTTHDIAELGSSIEGFEGAAFDGHFLYLVPSPGGTVVRYDTSEPFSSEGAWLAYDAGPALGITPAYAGAIFDGRYVNFVPAKSSTFVRYDTRSSFDEAASWLAFDPIKGSTLTHAAGYAGGTFDGKNVYFIPNGSTWGQQHDPTTVFTNPSLWSAHHVVPLDSDAGPGFFGAAFDGRYVYMAPGTLLSDSAGFLLRFDTTGNFTDNSAFDTFNMQTVNPGAASFTDAAFDGRYVYFAPSGRAGQAVVTRFDSHGELSDLTAWSAFDMSSLSSTAGDFFGVAFDGRYLYFPPWGTTPSGMNGEMVRLDTTAPFETKSSWSTFDTNSIHAAGFQASAFDGQFVYFAPQAGTVVARFSAHEARTTLKIPGYFGSFF